MVLQLDRILDRCRALEERAAAVYRAFAARARSQPPLCALWTALAREEEDHARALAAAREHLEWTEGWGTRLSGWEEALGSVEERLAAAEQLDSGAGPDRQLAAALDLEMTELEPLRSLLLAASRQGEAVDPSDHAVRLAEAATRYSDDPHVRLEAALLLARARLKDDPE